MIGEMCGIYSTWNSHLEAKRDNIYILANFLATHIDDRKLAADLARCLSVKWKADLGWSVVGKKAKKKSETDPDTYMINDFFAKWYPSSDTKQRKSMLKAICEKIVGFYTAVYMQDFKKAQSFTGQYCAR